MEQIGAQKWREFARLTFFKEIEGEAGGIYTAKSLLKVRMSVRLSDNWELYLVKGGGGGPKIAK